MKKNYNVRFLLIIISILGSSQLSYSQSAYKIIESRDIDMKLSGTSTLHKWSMDARAFTGTAEFNLKPGSENELVSLRTLTFSLAVKDLKSGEKGLDKNAYKALKTDEYKDIYYKLISAAIQHEKGNNYLLKTHGNLTIAGITKEIDMDVHCTINKDASITCTGSDKLQMSDYRVKPPSFMLGAMKTGDAITLDFIIVYKK